MGKYALRVQLGRWQGTDDVVPVEDLDDATLKEVALRKVVKCNGVDDCLQRSTMAANTTSLRSTGLATAS